MRSAFRAPTAVLIAGVMLSAPIGCSDGTSPDAPPQTRITYASTNDELATEPDRATISVAEGKIVIEGGFTAADPCRELAAALAVDGGVVRVTVRGELPPNPQGCIAVIQRFTYAASVSGIASGSWTVEVYHRAFGLGQPTLVASGPVVLP